MLEGGEILMLERSIIVALSKPSNSLFDAESTTVPMATDVSNPVLDRLAIFESEDNQVTLELRFSVELSEYVPVATNCSLSPIFRLCDKALMVMLFRVMILPGAVSEKPPKLAVIFTLPAERVVNSPEEEMLAMSVSEDDQLAVLVRSSVLESE